MTAAARAAQPLASADTQVLRVLLAVALTIGCGPLLWLGYALSRACHLGLGPAQGAAAGVAWAFWHGAGLYRGLPANEGPLVYEIHALVQRAFGVDSYALRVADMTITGCVFAFVGAALVRASLAARPVRLRGAVLVLVAWAAACAVLSLATYVALYGHDQLATASSFGCWFTFGALGCILWARAARGGQIALTLAGVLSASGWFISPMALLVSVWHAALLASATLDRVARRRALRAFGIGIALAIALQIALLLAWGSVPGFWQAAVLAPLRTRSSLAFRSLLDGLLLSGRAELVPLPLVLALASLGFCAFERARRKWLVFAALPLVALATALLDASGSAPPLHALTASAGVLLLWLGLQAALAVGDANVRSDLAPLLWPLALAGLTAVQSANLLIASPNLRAEWSVALGRTRERRATPAFLVHFDGPAFPSAALGRAAAFITQHTAPNDRVALYGVHPYLLALAERRPANSQRDARALVFADSEAFSAFVHASPELAGSLLRDYPNRASYTPLIVYVAAR